MTPRFYNYLSRHSRLSNYAFRQFLSSVFRGGIRRKLLLLPNLSVMSRPVFSCHNRRHDENEGGEVQMLIDINTGDPR
jgi:hypothetical protein